MKTLLGLLERVDVKDVWSHEAQDFTPWLAKEENLKLLGEALDIDLAPSAEEQPVGPYRADILAKRTDTPDEHFVLIENQLEKTDHSHLGQLMTYAAGLKAATVVWIAARFTAEHRAALDWLNEITAPQFAFFGLEIELWRIAGSPQAPKFNVVAQPNEFVRAVGGTVDEAVGKTKQVQQRYWAALSDVLIARKGGVRPQKPLPQHWTSFAAGRSGTWLGASVDTRGKKISVEFAIRGPEGKVWYDQIEAQKANVEAAISSSLSWERLPNRKMSRVAAYLAADPMDESDWSRQHTWLAENLESFKRIFGPMAKKLPASDEIEPDELPDVGDADSGSSNS